jgi:DNA-binding transcriptional MerR regulator
MAELRIGELAARSGVSIDTVRYYEQRRLLPRAPRTQSGYRVFARDTVERIRFIKEAQEIGLSLDEIKELLTGEGGADKCRRVSELLRAKLDELAQRIKSMQNFRRTLSHHLSKCERELDEKGEAAECPVIMEITHFKQT